MNDYITDFYVVAPIRSVLLFLSIYTQITLSILLSNHVESVPPRL